MIRYWRSAAKDRLRRAAMAIAKSEGYLFEVREILGKHGEDGFLTHETDVTLSTLGQARLRVEEEIGALAGGDK